MGRIDRVAGVSQRCGLALITLALAGALVVGVLTGEVTAKEALEAIPGP